MALLASSAFSTGTTWDSAVWTDASQTGGVAAVSGGVGSMTADTGKAVRLKTKAAVKADMLARFTLKSLSGSLVLGVRSDGTWTTANPSVPGSGYWLNLSAEGAQSDGLYVAVSSGGTIGTILLNGPGTATPVNTVYELAAVGSTVMWRQYPVGGTKPAFTTAADTTVTAAGVATMGLELEVSSGAHTSTIDDFALYDPPTVSASSSGGGTINNPVSLSATPGNLAGSASYLWALTAWPAGASTAISGTSSQTPTHTPTVAGVYTYRVAVTDDSGLTATATVSRTISSHATPTVNAGADVSTTTSGAVNITGSEVLTDSATVASRLWTIQSAPDGSTATLSGATTATVTLGTAGRVAGTYTLRYSVTDSLNATGYDDVNVIVAPVVAPPGDWTSLRDLFVAPLGAATLDIEITWKSCASGEAHAYDAGGVWTGSVTDWSPGGRTDDITVTFEASIDGSLWVPVRGGENLTPASGELATHTDYEAIPGVPTLYRATPTMTVPDSGLTISGAPSTPVTVTALPLAGWLKDPLDPTVNMRLAGVRDFAAVTEDEDDGVFKIPGRPDVVVVSDVQRMRAGSVTLLAMGVDDRIKLATLLSSGRVLLLQTPSPAAGEPGEHIYLRRVGAKTTAYIAAVFHPTRDITFQWVEQPSP